MTGLEQLLTDLLSELQRNPLIAAFAAGLGVGWALARRATRYMIGGRF